MKSKRRTFLKTAAFAGASTLAAPYIAKSAGDKKLRVALVGLGGRGWNGTLIGKDPKVDVTAVCDVDTTRFTSNNERNGSVGAPSEN